MADGSSVPIHLPAPEEYSASTGFFHVAHAAFLAAERAGGEPVRRRYSVSGHGIELRLAGPALLPVAAPALEHLCDPGDQAPALTVCLWDSASTGVPMPSPPWDSQSYIARGEVLGYSDERIHTAFHMGVGALSMLDAQRSLALYWVRDARQVPYYETGAPLRTILHWWTRRRGWQFVHGAVVGTRDGGVLLAGRSGSGKSTTALACLSAGLLYVGDDYVLLQPGPAPMACSLYNTAKLDAAQMRQFPDLLPAVRNADRLGQEKALAFVHVLYPERVARRLALRAILVPRVTGLPNTRITKASPAAGLMALAPSTIFQLARAGAADLHTLGEFAARLPTYILEAGTDLAQIPQVIRRLLSEGRHAA